ncbi:MAG: hypothetical protein RBU37_27355, partial [Myxococcota bacterium]|nr:hypothetical protein [Myxococcota bacterium]
MSRQRVSNASWGAIHRARRSPQSYSRPRRRTHFISALLATLLLAAALLVACREEPLPPEAGQPSVLEDAIVKESSAGPVKATLTVGPSKPKLGDVITLLLEVEAEAGVELLMPPFGEQLGRFGIVDFTPEQQINPDGSSKASQRYRLDLPMSGKQRIPSLLIEFIDRRPGQDAEPKELLTEEVVLEVESLSVEATTSTPLRPPREALPELEAPQAAQSSRTWWFIGAAAVAVLGLGLLLWWLRRRRGVVQLSAYERAWQRL